MELPLFGRTTGHYDKILAVLRLVVEGESYKKIAESLCISPETVKWHFTTHMGSA